MHQDPLPECNTRFYKIHEDLATIKADVKNMHDKLDDMIEKMDHNVYTGNGSPGLMQRVAVLESKQEDEKEDKKDQNWVTSAPVIIGGVILGLAAAIKAWLLN